MMRVCVYIPHMTRIDSQRIGRELKEWLERNGMTERSLAQEINRSNPSKRRLSQSWVSRICNGEFKRVAGQAEVVLKYADIRISLLPDNPSKAADVIDEAVREVWDGSERGAQLIANLLRNAAAFSGKRRRDFR